MTAVCHDIHGLRAAGATYREIAALTGLTLSQINYRLNPPLNHPAGETA